MKIKVLIVDDHPIVREGLKQILTDSSDIVVAGEASNGEEAIEKIAENDFDIILLDVTMPHTDGLEVIKRLRTKRSTVPVLMLSIHPVEHYAVRFIRAGVAGYLTKESAPDELIEAIRNICKGERHITPAVAERLSQHRDKRTQKKIHEKLSNREYQVLCLIGEGLKPQEIAKRLSIRPKTVSTYRDRIIKKTGLKTNADITRYVVKYNLCRTDGSIGT